MALTGMLADSIINELLVKSPDPKQACQALIDAANAAGGKDNVDGYCRGLGWQQLKFLLMEH